MNRHRSILVVLDHFPLYAVFVAAPGASPTGKVAMLFQNHMVKYFSFFSCCESGYVVSKSHGQVLQLT